MTGLDCLREEMLRRGCNKMQIESKAVAVVLDILSQSPECIFELQADAEKSVGKLEERYEKLTKEVEQLESCKAELKEYVESLRRGAKAVVNAEWDREQKYIDDFYRALENCETKEGRDRLRAAQVFINTVGDLKENTRFNETAYINWVGALLTGTGAIVGIEAMKQINPKAYETDPWGDRRSRNDSKGKRF